MNTYLHEKALMVKIPGRKINRICLLEIGEDAIFLHCASLKTSIATLISSSWKGILRALLVSRIEKKLKTRTGRCETIIIPRGKVKAIHFSKTLEAEILKIETRNGAYELWSPTGFKIEIEKIKEEMRKRDWGKFFIG